jgi:hypothetical protein
MISLLAAGAIGRVNLTMMREGKKVWGEEGEE